MQDGNPMKLRTEIRLLWDETCLAMTLDKHKSNQNITGHSIARYAKYCFNQMFVDLLLALLLNLQRLRYSLERDRDNREKQVLR